MRHPLLDRGRPAAEPERHGQSITWCIISQSRNILEVPATRKAPSSPRRVANRPASSVLATKYGGRGRNLERVCPN